MQPLLPAFRRALRARAHHLHPVVSIGHQGLTAAVLHEADVALLAHEIIKVRVLADDRDERKALLDRLCEALDCAPVQQIGKLLVLWRPRPQPASAASEEATKAVRPRAKGQAPRAKPRSPTEKARAPVVTPRTPRAEAPRTPRRPAATPPSGVPRAAPRRRRRVTG